MMPMSSHGPAAPEPIIVEVEGIGELEFPGDTDPSVIHAKVKELTSGVPAGSVGTGDFHDRQSYKELQAAGFGPLLAGAESGGMNTVDAPAPKFIQGLATRLYSGLLKPAKAVKDSFGGARAVAETLLNERAPITPGGVTKVTARLKGSRDTAMGMVKAAENAGTQGVVPKDVLGEFGSVVGELRKRADIGQTNELGRVGARGRAILKTTGGRGGDVPLTRAQALKETAQDASSGAYRAMDRGTQKQLSADDLLDTAVARGLKEGIERKVPGVKAQNATTQRLLGGTRALEDAVEREANNNMLGGGRDWAALGAAGVGTAVGGPTLGAAGGAMMRALATPSIGSRAAIGLNEVGRLPIEDVTRREILNLLRSRSNSK